MTCRSGRLAVLVSFFIIPACGTYARPSTWAWDASGADRVRTARESSGTLVRRDMVTFEGHSLADAVAQLRPDWLRSNPFAHVNSESPSQVPILYINDIASGEVTGLRAIPSEAAIEVRLLSRSEAWARYGPPCHCPAGALVVRTRSNE